MYLSRRWLNQFIDLTGVKNEQITVALNSLGFEVESFKDYSNLNDKLKIAHVGNVSPIPDTHLNFCFVDKGEDLVSPIICGATNVKEGQFVIVAEPGVTISNGLTLTTKEIKGKTSEGMICSLIEIGMDKNALTEDEQDWIYPIITREDTYTLIGQDNALEKIGFIDAIWEVDLTLNRSDALGAFQLVKELANYFDKDIVDVSKQIETKHNSNNMPFEIKIEKNLKDTIRSLSAQIFDIKEVISIEKNEPAIYSFQDIWLKFNKSKTQNNFWLDLSNAIAIETGQPIIFVDPTKVSKTLTIENNISKEKEANLQLLSEDSVISTIGVDFDTKFLPDLNSKQVVAIYLSLDPIFMRKQQKTFNYSTIALQRYMKPISSKLYSLAEQRLIYWLDQYNLYGSSSKLHFIVESVEEQKIIEVKLEYLNNLIGFNLSADEIKKLFKTLDFEVNIKNDILEFKIDQYRTDINLQSDIAEEVARIYGYNNIEAKPPVLLSEVKSKNFDLKLDSQIESYLLGLSFNNIKTYSLMNDKEVLKWNLFDFKNPIRLMSPLSNLRETYRLSLVRSIIETASLNYSRNNKNLKLYEFADVYNLDGLRERHLSGLISGDVTNQKAFNIDIKASFSYLKGIVEEILDHYNLNILEVEFKVKQDLINEIHPYMNAQISYKNEVIGYIFKLNPRFEQSLKLDSTFVFELSLTRINQLLDPVVRATELSKFQKTTRDVSFILNDEQKYIEVLNTIIKDIDYLTGYQLIDIYQDDKLKAENKKSISLSFEFNSNEQQLTDEQIAKQWDKLLSNLKKLNIEVR